MTYKCDNCNKIFKLKHHLTYHLNKKKLCEKVENEQNNCKCLLCDKEYSFLSGLIRHRKTHKNYDEEVKKLKDKQKEESNELNKLRELFIIQNEKFNLVNEKFNLVIDQHKKEVELLNKKIEDLTNNNTINNTTNNKNVII